MSDPKPTDYPIARGVSPPPRPIRRVHGSPAKAPPKTIVELQVAIRPAGKRIVVLPPVASKRWPIIVAQAGAVVLLAGFCMAAGWWVVHRNDPPPRPNVPAPAPVLVKAEPVKPGLVVKPVEAPVSPSKPVEKPAAPMPVVKPLVPAPAPPPKPMDKPTTTLTFQKDILPILQAKCILCHGDKNKLKGGLDVRTLRTLEKGGESGPAINHQSPETSLLWDSVSSGQMPPGKSKVSESDKKKLHDWLVGSGK